VWGQLVPYLRRQRALRRHFRYHRMLTSKRSSELGGQGHDIPAGTYRRYGRTPAMVPELTWNSHKRNAGRASGYCDYLLGLLRSPLGDNP
jgi:hypothetical protein